MSDIPLQVVRPEDGNRHISRPHAKIDHSLEIALPAYTSNDGAPSYSPPNNALSRRTDDSDEDTRLSIDKQQAPAPPAWKTWWKRRFFGVPAWIFAAFVALLVVVAAIVGGVLGSRAAKAKSKDLFRPNTFYMIKSHDKNSLYMSGGGWGENATMAQGGDFEGSPSLHWQLRRLPKNSPFEDSCAGGVGHSHALYWLASNLQGPTQRLGFRERLFTPQEASDSGHGELELIMSADAEDARSQVWFAVKNAGGMDLHTLYNCATGPERELWFGQASESLGPKFRPYMKMPSQDIHFWRISALDDIRKPDTEVGWIVD